MLDYYEFKFPGTNIDITEIPYIYDFWIFSNQPLDARYALQRRWINHPSRCHFEILQYPYIVVLPSIVGFRLLHAQGLWNKKKKHDCGNIIYISMWSFHSFFCSWSAWISQPFISTPISLFHFHVVELSCWNIFGNCMCPSNHISIHYRKVVILYKWKGLYLVIQ